MEVLTVNILDTFLEERLNFMQKSEKYASLFLVSSSLSGLGFLLFFIAIFLTQSLTRLVLIIICLVAFLCCLTMFLLYRRVRKQSRPHF